MANINKVLQSVREDDFIEYFIFPSASSNNEKEEELILNSVLKKITKTVDKYTNEYLWHKDEFKLTPRTIGAYLLNDEDDKNQILPPHLYGISHYGDNIEDEWFIVYLLQQITSDNTDLVARIIDADGEFLLIEAANYLPAWATPETCTNRVYISNGLVHVIPLENDEDTAIEVVSALEQIRNAPSTTQASSDVQNSIKNKLNGYPGKISENLHRATAYLPIGVAAILKQRPNLISAAVQSFCNRDPVDARACRAMKYFPPENRVYRSVTLTKCLYAMLTHSRYVPDRRTGWNLPNASSPQYKSHVLGVKIACGFEILVAQAKPSQDVEQDRGWVGYLKSLEDKGYFRNLVEHSRDYNDLLNKAKEYYINHRDSMHYAPVIGQEILNLTKTLDYKVDELKKEEASLPKDDDEDWLNISPEELDRMLQERYGQKKTFQANNNSDASNFAAKVTTFLDHVSDFEGAEFPTITESPVRPPRGVKRKEKPHVSFSDDVKDRDSNKVNFDPNSFSCAVQNILNFVIPDDDAWESESDMSEYEEDKGVDLECEGGKTTMQEYMDEMDRELAGTTMGESFVKKSENGDGFDDIEDFHPVDIDMNALKNILESYRCQMGEAGPSSNMLGPMGVYLDNKNGQN